MAVQIRPVGTITIDSDLATEVASVLARSIEVPGKVLVVGDGSQTLVEALSVTGWRIHEQVTPAGGSTSLINFDADTWFTELSDASFDTVVVFNVLEFAADPLAILRALRAALPPDGCLAVVVPNVAHGSVRLTVLGGGFPFQDWQRPEKLPIRFYTHEGLRSLFQSADLAISEIVRKTQTLDASGNGHAAHSTLETLSSDPDALASHFIVIARPPATRDDSAPATLSKTRDALLNLYASGWSGPGDPIEQARYRRMIHRIRGLVRATLPTNATVLVVSRGDEALLALDQRTAWHFPMAPDGKYAGYHPADSGAAVSHLEALRDRGAGFLLIPSTSLWWLEHYDDFARHLEHHYATAARRDDTCVIFDLGARP